MNTPAPPLLNASTEDLLVNNDASRARGPQVQSQRLTVQPSIRAVRDEDTYINNL